MCPEAVALSVSEQGLFHKFAAADSVLEPFSEVVASHYDICYSRL